MISEGVYYKADMVAGRLYTRKANSPFENAPKRIDGVFSWPNFYTEMFSGSQYYQAESGSSMVSRLRCTVYIYPQTAYYLEFTN